MGNVKVVNFRSVPKGSLLGFLNIFIESVGMEIYDLTVFQKDGRRWFNLPTREYEDKESGEKKYARRVHFPDETYYNAFMEAVRNAFDDYCHEQAKLNEPVQQLEEPDKDLPF